MRKTFALTILLALLALGSVHPVQWALLKQSSDPAELKNDMSRLWNQGYCPVGFEVVPRDTPGFGTYVLYIKSKDFRFQAWDFRWYTDFDRVESDIQDKIDAGWIPMDVSYTGDRLFALFVKSKDLAVTGWRIEPARNNLESMKSVIDSAWGKDYCPAGMSAWGEESWVLLLRAKGLEWNCWQILSFELSDDAVREGVDDATENGWIPWGVMVRWGRVSVLFIR